MNKYETYRVHFASTCKKMAL